MRNKIIGGVVGGAIGFIIAAIVVDQLYPEYYEDTPVGMAVREAFDQVNRYRSDETVQPEPLIKRLKKRDLDARPVDYTRYGTKPPLDEMSDNMGVSVDDVVTNIFEEHRPDEGDLSEVEYEEYLAVRDEEEPYFLSLEEFDGFILDEPDIPTVGFTYYMKDDVIVESESQRPLEIDPTKLLGPDALSPQNLGLWGHDHNITIIYNPELKVIYRIYSAQQSYEETAAGAVEETKRTKRKEEDGDNK